MASPSRGWTSARISYIAARIFFVLIIFQLPLFRVQCRSGMCTTPIQITSCQLTANEIFPSAVVKALLYPGAAVNSLVSNMTLPKWNNILHMYNLTEVKNASAVVDLQRLEVLCGSYFAVAGALIGVINPGRMSMFGTLLIVWGLVKEGFLGKPANTNPATAVYVSPAMVLAIISAVFSVRYNLKKAVKGSQARPVAKPLQSSVKSKLK
ncbi:uncharacterized protein A4U43_C08F7390 [Asparagus officinalis]|uniref:uncharacterized protein LOC109820142 n=1 Tax=Asparagus officinalis TaxID=4686 RepID=UPI00098E24DE|nr:uncharacterized protein LOC109820142 [Asparagus officinalis]XP_020241828.1 uncharacterized protein LOC109820142 [Asparagus officinalis]ONK59532.1 uncharacterized protein A4U43_C08F7390 [Asparagus officinalis]